MADPQTIQRIRRIAAGTARVGSCLAFVAATTWAAFSVLRVNSLIAGFAYVLVVLVVAAKWGLAESVLTSVAAMLCLNYFFLPPILSLTIADPQNWVALFAFLVTAITASKLSSIARERADEAQTRRIEVEHLYQFSRSLMLIDSTKDLGTQIAGQVKERFGFSGVAYCDGLSGELSMIGLPDAMLEHQVLRDIAVGTASWFAWRKETTPEGIEVVVAPVSLAAAIAVFLAGLMVGRTPEYLGKKIGPAENKMIMLYALAAPLVILPLTAIAVSTRLGLSGLTTNGGPHGFTEILFAYTSCFANNGQTFAGLSANSPFYNLTTGLAMMAGRFGLAIPALAFAALFGRQRKTPSSSGTLPTYSFSFGILLTTCLITMVALSYLPALALGPVLERLLFGR
jgi:hypothetical protein